MNNYINHWIDMKNDLMMDEDEVSNIVLYYIYV